MRAKRSKLDPFEKVYEMKIRCPWCMKKGATAYAIEQKTLGEIIIAGMAKRKRPAVKKK